ncbi:hypothetical protein [Actinophytocola sp.]|uniref:hypothetical protein n=1 Tax=Actinophytocola sp. TaxID=1872138 RepID=UPI002D80F6A9|nr:hypothetical protein [Actinophytocola sp.]HET9144164.1 hypothetical protein [Actinophytocola sp.]
MATNTEAAAVRARRKAAAKTDPDKPPAPVTVGADEPARRYEALGDPREPRVQVGTMPDVPDGHQFSRPHPLARPREVAEATGWSMDRADSDDFVVAECDVYESILPKGCTTPTSRMRWAKGQHVPVEVYRAWEAERDAAVQAAEETVVPETPQD